MVNRLNLKFEHLQKFEIFNLLHYLLLKIGNFEEQKKFLSQYFVINLSFIEESSDIEHKAILNFS